MLIAVLSLEVILHNFAALAWIVRRFVTPELPTGPGRHLDFQVADVVIHSDAVTDAPSAFEHSAGHRVFIKPQFLIRFHGDPSLPEKTSLVKTALLQRLATPAHVSAAFFDVSFSDNSSLEMFLIFGKAFSRSDRQGVTFLR